MCRLHCGTSTAIRSGGTAIGACAGMALACACLKAASIQQGDMATVVLNQTACLQASGGLGHAFPAYTERMGDLFLGHHQCIAAQQIKAQQQPATQLLFKAVVAIADDGLRHLREQALHVLLCQVLQFAIRSEVQPEWLCAYAICLPGLLDDGTTGRCSSAHEQGDADHAVIAGNRSFGGRAIRHDMQQRHDAGDGEVQPFERGTGFAQHPAARQVYQFEVGAQTRMLSRRQGCKYAVMTSG